MASATSQSTQTISRAIDIVKHKRHGDIDPAVTTFLERTIDAIWQRVKAQPSTYLFTRDEFAVFTLYRDRFGGNEIAQQAVRRFWEHQDASEAAGANRVSVHLCPSVSRERSGRVDPANSLGISPEETLPGRSTFAWGVLACDRCYISRIICDRIQPVCTTCRRAGWDLSCTYNQRKKDGHLAELIENKKLMNDAVNMPDNNLERRSPVMESRDRSIERQKQQMSPTGKVDERHLKSVDPTRMHVTNGEVFNTVNSLKLYIEYLTSEAWDW